MVDENVNRFGGKVRTTGGSGGSGGSRSTKEYEQWDEACVQVLLAAMNESGGEIIAGLHDSDAGEIPDEIQEEFGLPEGATHFSVESLSPVDISEVKGIGTAVSVTYEQLQASVEAGVIDEDTLTSLTVSDDGTERPIEPGESVQWRPDYVESTPQSDISMCLNGYHAEAIQEVFGDDFKVRVRAAPKSWATAAHERYSNVSFYASNSKQAALSRERARLTVGEISQSEFNDWAIENGFEDEVEN